MSGVWGCIGVESVRHLGQRRVVAQVDEDESDHIDEVAWQHRKVVSASSENLQAIYRAHQTV